MPRNRKVRNRVLTLAGLALLIFGLYLIENSASVKLGEAVALFAIWGIAAVSLNLINGVTGILSLGHHGFMLVGGYTTGLLVLSQDTQELISSTARSQMTEFTLGLNLQSAFSAMGLTWLASPEALGARFLLALFIGGLVAALFGIIVGFPSLRLRGDYLAIVTFAFGEVIRLLASTPLLGGFTNGALGFAVPSQFGKSVWWTFSLLAVTVLMMSRLKFNSYGRALQGIREDEVAAEAMGVNTSYHKVLAFAISAFFAGVAGGLWVSWVGTARLDLFLFTLTFYFLVAISAGGTGSVTGVLLGTALVVFLRQYGDPLEQAYPLSTWLTILGLLLVLSAAGTFAYRALSRMRPRWHPVILPLAAVGLITVGFAQFGTELPALQQSWQGFGMRAILLSVLLIVIMVFRPSGILGRSEFSWAWLFGERKDRPTEEERAQDAWLSNPELNERADDPDPAAHPLLERGERPDDWRGKKPEEQ